MIDFSKIGFKIGLDSDAIRLDFDPEAVARLIPHVNDVIGRWRTTRDREATEEAMLEYHRAWQRTQVAIREAHEDLQRLKVTLERYADQEVAR